MTKPDINTAYGLPRGFFELIKPYVSANPKVASESERLIAIWDGAFKYKNQYPKLSEKIAEWTVSAGASSPLINDNDIFDAIHSDFGRLEVAGNANSPESKQLWDELSKLLTQLKHELK
jgi:hypothetical protein